LESDGKDYCPCDKFAVAPPSTEESGEPIDVARDSITVTDKHYEDARKLLKSHAKADLLNVIAISGALYEFWLGSKSTPASETSDYLRGKLDEGGEPMEMARSGAAIRKMHDDLFFVDWGNVRFGTTLKGLADLGHDLGLYVSRQLKRGA
jgi:hypothetical protein